MLLLSCGNNGTRHVIVRREKEKKKKVKNSQGRNRKSLFFIYCMTLSSIVSSSSCLVLLLLCLFIQTRPDSVCDGKHSPFLPFLSFCVAIKIRRKGLQWQGKVNALTKWNTFNFNFKKKKKKRQFPVAMCRGSENEKLEPISVFVNKHSVLLYFFFLFLFLKTSSFPPLPPIKY